MKRNSRKKLIMTKPETPTAKLAKALAESGLGVFGRCSVQMGGEACLALALSEVLTDC